MPSEHISLAEAKANLSRLVRRVAAGERVVITVHGKPMAEMQPVHDEPPATTFAARQAQLIASGEIIPSERAPGEVRGLHIVARRPGALARFLAERGR